MKQQGRRPRNKAATESANEPPKETGSPPKVVDVTDVDILQTACAKPIHVEFDFQGTRYRVEARRLEPFEEATLEHVLSVIVPPMKPGKKEGEFIPDFGDAAYIRRKLDAEVQARALALYWAVPIFKKKQPGLSKPEEITSLIQRCFNHDILTILWTAIRSGGVSMAELVNFTSPNSSPQS